MKQRIKPFSKPGYTMFNNAILDHIMPDLSGRAWKILCVAIRQTIGWVDEETESGRKESDRISYTQFMEKSGLSRATVWRGLKECLAKQYLLRWPATDHKQGFEYSLNQDFEMEVETGSIVELVSPETGLNIKPVTPPKPVQYLNPQKKGVKQRGIKKGGARPSRYMDHVQH